MANCCLIHVRQTVVGSFSVLELDIAFAMHEVSSQVAYSIQLGSDMQLAWRLLTRHLVAKGTVAPSKSNIMGYTDF